jgi:hypothetical protein
MSILRADIRFEELISRGGPACGLRDARSRLAHLQDQRRDCSLWPRAARITLPLTLALIALVSIWTPFTHPQIALRRFIWPNIAYLSPVPIVTTAVSL